MGSSSRLVALAVVAVLVGAGAWYGLAAGHEAAPEGSTASAQPAASDADSPAALPRFDAVRDAIAPLTPAAPAGEAAAATPAAELSVASLARLVGRVTRKASGAPVAGLKVQVECDPVVEPVAAFTTAQTDADGRFRFAYASPARVSNIRVGSSPDTRGVLRELDLDLEPGAESVQDFELVPGATASGRVVDQDGQPVPGARVRAWNAPAFRVDDHFPGPAPDEEVVANAAGEFRVGSLGPSFTLAVDAPGLSGLEQLTGELASGAEVEGLTLTLGAARDLHGVVLAGTEPVAQCRVDVEPEGDGNHLDPAGPPGVFRAPPPAGRAFSDASGVFVLPGLASRPYRVRAWHNRYVPWEGRHAPGDPELVVQLDPGARLTGEVVSSRGGPVADAEVTICTLGDGPWPRALHQVRSDSEGRFEAGGLAPDDRGVLLVQGDDHAVHVEQPVVITAEGPNHVRVLLDPARALAGIVVDEAGQPLPDQLVHIEGDRLLPMPAGMTVNPLPTWEGQFHGLNVTRTDAQGAFRLGSLYDGTFEIMVDDPNGQGVAARVEARSGSEDLRIVVGRSSGVTLVGTVRDGATGVPVEVFEIVAMIPSGAGGMTGDNYPFEDPTGAFRITGLRPGPIEPWLRAEGYSDVHVPLRDYAEGEHRLDLTMSADRTLHLRVLDEDREAVEGATVAFRDEAGESLWIKSGPNSGTTSLETDELGEVIAMGLPAAFVTARVRTGHFSQAQEFRFDLRHELRGVQVLVLGDEGGQTTVLVFFFGTSEAPAPGAAAQDFSATMQGLKAKLAAGTVWPIDTPLVVRALAADGKPLAQQVVTPGGANPDSMPLPDVTGVCNVKLAVPAEPLEIEGVAEGYASVRRAWQPDRSSDTGDVVVLLLTRKS
jgi:protocatechuate 3,4-dioxygenase beta subunit